MVLISQLFIRYDPSDLTVGEDFSFSFPDDE